MADGHLAFVSAMPMELTPLAHDLELTEVGGGGRTVHRGRLGDRAVVAIVTGMGTELATRGIEALLEPGRGRPRARGRDHRRARERDADRDARPARDRRRQRNRPGAPPVPIGDADHEGRMWTTDALTTDLDMLAELRAQGVVSLDMETAAIAWRVRTTWHPVVGLPRDLRPRRATVPSTPRSSR